MGMRLPDIMLLLLSMGLRYCVSTATEADSSGLSVLEETVTGMD